MRHKRGELTHFNLPQTPSTGGNTMAERIQSIQCKLKRFHSLISKCQEGGPNTRYKSWEWCHQAFINGKNDSSPDIDFLSLHLAFYLASWGMYRGSSYLLQRDYKAHKKAVNAMLEQQYELLWDFKPTDDVSINKANELLFDSDKGIYWRVKDSYKVSGDNYDDEASDTLTTKILMGTFGCIPAFDRFLKRGIRQYCDKIASDVNGFQLTQSIEKQDKAKREATDSFKALASLALNNQEDFKIASDQVQYPPMKCVDMYLWEIGYELDLADSLDKIDTATKNTRKKGLWNGSRQYFPKWSTLFGPLTIKS